MRPTFFLLQCVLACRGLLQQGYYCNDLVTAPKTHFVVGCCHPTNYPNVQSLCLSDLTQTTNGVPIYPAPQLVVFPCTTQANAIAGLASATGATLECDLFSTNAYTLYYEASNANMNIDVQAPYQQDFYFCQPAGTACVAVEPCYACPSTQYREGCGQFPTGVPANTPVSLAQLLQEVIGSCSMCGQCASGSGFTGCNYDGTPQCSVCSGLTASAGGYNQCQSCPSCNAGYGLSGCISPTQSNCVACDFGTQGGTYSAGNLPCQNCPSNAFTIQTTCLCVTNYVFSFGQCSLCAPGSYYFFQTTFTSSVQYTQECVQCPVNYYCAGGTSPQTACPVGTTCPNPGMSQPQPCPAGFFCPTIGQVKPCPEGFYCPYGSSIGTPCPSGTWGTNTGQATAALACPNTCGLDPGCQPGQYTVFCELYFQGICGNCAASCGAGQYQIGCGGTGVTDDSSCQACAAGTYSTAAGVRQCTACPTGATSSAGSSGCTCNAGYSQTSGTACAACQPNSYSSAGAASCTCNSGFYLVGAGSCAACQTCPSTSVLLGCQGAAAGSCSACPACPSNTVFGGCYIYGASITSSCPGCPAGLHNTGGYATVCTNCSACPAGTYAACDGTTRCVPCAQCNAGNFFFISVVRICAGTAPACACIFRRASRPSPVSRPSGSSAARRPSRRGPGRAAIARPPCPSRSA